MKGARFGSGIARAVHVLSLGALLLALPRLLYAQSAPDLQAEAADMAARLYQDGDYVRALDIYLNLAELDESPDWQFPVFYQVALIYERLDQPALAIETYQKIIDRESELTEYARPGTKATVEMSKWRRDFIGWKLEAARAKIQLQRIPELTPATPPEAP